MPIWERTKILFKASSVKGKAGSVIFQVHHRGVSCAVRTPYRLLSGDWPLLWRILQGKPLEEPPYPDRQATVLCPVLAAVRPGGDALSAADSVPAENPDTVDEPLAAPFPFRSEPELDLPLRLSIPELQVLAVRIQTDRERLKIRLREKDEQGCLPDPGEIRKIFRRPDSDTTVFGFMRQLVERLRRMNRVRTAETYQAALYSFMGFRKGADLKWEEVDALQVEMFEAYLRSRGMVRNTSSFYMRIFRAVYNRAVEKGLALPVNPFRRVYTGVDKTVKRAIPLEDIRKIMRLDLSSYPTLAFSRDMFLFSFYLRGMSFVDMAYLRKDDLREGVLHYRRRKTGQSLSIHWEACMQDIVDRYAGSRGGSSAGSPFLLPIFRSSSGKTGDTGEGRYRSRLLLVNRNLKKVAEMAGLESDLTMYVARHSWASAAWRKNIPVSVISEGMGHDSEQTTRIYLASLENKVVDAANRAILDELRG